MLDHQNAEAGEVEEENAARQAGEDVVAEKALQRHCQLRQHWHPEMPWPPLRGQRVS